MRVLSLLSGARRAAGELSAAEASEAQLLVIAKQQLAHATQNESQSGAGGCTGSNCISAVMKSKAFQQDLVALIKQHMRQKDVAGNAENAQEAAKGRYGINVYGS